MAKPDRVGLVHPLAGIDSDQSLIEQLIAFR